MYFSKNTFTFKLYITLTDPTNFVPHFSESILLFYLIYKYKSRFDNKKNKKKRIIHFGTVVRKLCPCINSGHSFLFM